MTSKDSSEESNLFKSLTDRNLTEEQQDEYRKIKKLTGALSLVDNDEESSESNDDDDFLYPETDFVDDPGPSTSIVGAGDPAASNDERTLLINKYMAGEISFEDLMKDPKWLADENLKETEDQPVETENEVDLTYEDNMRDKDFVPPRSLKRQKLAEKQNEPETSTTADKTPVKNVPTTSKLSEMDYSLVPRRTKRKRRPKSILPPDLGGLLGQARLCFVRNDRESAIKMCMEVIRLGGHTPEVYETLDMFFEDTEDLNLILSLKKLVAYTKRTDAAEWLKVAEIYAELEKFNEAAFYFKKALHFDPKNVHAMWSLFHLSERLNEKEKCLGILQQIAKMYTPEEGERILFVSKEIAKRLYKNGHVDQAKATMEESFFKYSNDIISEDVNFLLELKMKLGEYADSVKIFCDFCGVKFDPPFLAENSSDPANNISELTLQNRQNIITPDVLPIDLCVKLLICCLHLKAQHLTNDMKLTLIQSNSDENGDLYLDAAEAYMETGHANEAIPLLGTLASSEKYNKPLVWQKYGECQMAAGNLEEAESIYRHLVELDSSLTTARMVLSGILQQLGRPNESLEVLTSGMEDVVDLDPAIQIQRATLLYSRERWEDFVSAAKTLHSIHTLWKDDYNDGGTFSTCNISKVRDLFKQWKDEMPDHHLIEEGSVHTEEIWDIYKKMCQKMLELKQVEELEYATLTALASSIFTEKAKLKECHFMHLLACYFNKDYDRAYQLIKMYVADGITNNQSWNFFNIIVGLLKQLKHNRFCIRQMYKHPGHVQLGIINGHTAFASGSYKHALGEYMSSYRRNPKDPFNVFFIGITYTHIACQKFTIKKHSLVLQAIAFLHIYRELRGDTQETCYNIGRAMHQLGLSYLAVDYYKQVLAMKPAVASAPNAHIYDLSHDAAYNLAHIYTRSGSYDLARMYLYKYCIV